MRTLPKEISDHLTIDYDKGTYEPIIYLSDFWHLKKEFVPINDTLEYLNITLNF